MPHSFPTTTLPALIVGSPPGLRPTPPSACWRLHDADIVVPAAGRGRPARTRGSAPQTLAGFPVLGKLCGIGQFCQQPPSGGFFGLKEIPRCRQAPAESRRQPGLAAPQSGGAATKVVLHEARRAEDISPRREPWVPVANSPAPERGGRSSAAGTLSPRSGASGVFHPFPALTRWAIFFRPTDSGRAKIAVACEELAVV